MAATAAFFMGGFALAQTGEPTVETRTFTHEDVVTYTIPTETVTTTVTETVTVTTETEPPPTTTTEPPPQGVDCRVSNRDLWGFAGDGCRVGTTIFLTNEQYRCDGPLSGEGPLPVKVVHTYTTLVNDGDQGGMDIASGCRGDSDPDTVDLIYISNADGSTVGSCGGGGKFRALPGPQDLQVTANLDGGAVCGGAHQDGVQMQQTRPDANIDLVNSTSGDWDAGTSTVVGAGGSVFFSAEYDLDVYGGRFVSCNHGYFGAVSFNQVYDAGFRTGRIDGTDPKCAGVFSPPANNPCEAGADYRNTICERWSSAMGSWVPKGIG